MNRIRRLCRCLAALPGRASALIAFAAAPAAWRPDPPFPPGWMPSPGWHKYLPQPPGWHHHQPLPAHTHAPVSAVCLAGRPPSSRPGLRCWPPHWRCSRTGHAQLGTTAPST